MDAKPSDESRPALATRAANDMGRLRSAILIELFQHPASLLPWAASMLAGVWSVAVSASQASLATVVGGAAVGTAALFYNLMFRGAAIRDGILAKWEAEAERAEHTERAALRRALLALQDADDIRTAFELYETWRGEAQRALDDPAVSRILHSHFAPIIAENDESAMNLFQRLVALQQRLTNLLAAGARRDSQFAQKIGHLRENRQRILAHLAEVTAALQRAAAEVPAYGAREVDESARALRQLDESLEVARRAYDNLREETRSPSGLYRVRGSGAGGAKVATPG